MVIVEDKKEYFFSETEIREWLIGTDAACLISVYLDSDQDEVSKECLIIKLLESYQKRINQKIGRFYTVD
jgi:hypothetical protein